MKLLNEIQKSLKVPKSQYNDFGQYKYRSCSDIVEAVKPVLGNASLTMSDEIVLIGDRYYVKATVTLAHEGEQVSVTAYAREADARKGMNADQLTGATSSYARKYALNGLFAIDDTQDSDDTNKHGKGNGTGEDNNTKPENGKSQSNGNGKTPPKPTEDATKIISDTFEKYCEDHSGDVGEGLMFDSEKFKTALRALYVKTKDAKKKPPVFNAGIVENLAKSIEPFDILTEIK